VYRLVAERLKRTSKERQMPNDLEELAYRVKPRETVRLADLPADEKHGFNRESAESRLEELGQELASLQELLYGAATHSALIVLQGMDTSGKDGTIRRALTWLNPQACRVASFKEPTLEEQGHDFLWRVHQVTPARGFIAIFNRSHYEDVLAARVQHLVPRKVWSNRYQQINDFERLLESDGTILLKFYLHISKKEQRKRLLAREDDPDKAWKLSVSDWQAREDWDEYIAAYEDLLQRCSTKHAPWYIVPADHKWFRDLAVASTVVAALRRQKPEWEADLVTRGRQQLEALEHYRAVHGKNGD
jgi:PPK2 family polyphosphate:nucleotide phosphotransferase